MLVDLEGTKSDLEIACEFAVRLIDVISSPGAGTYVDVEALAIATIIRYARAFKGGIRKIDKPALLADLPSDILETHETILAWCDKHIAHSVNDFEEALIQARYCLENVNEEGITQVTVTRSRVISPGVDELHQIILSAKFFLSRIEGLIEVESARVLSYIRGRPLDEILAADLPALVPGKDRRNMSKPRAK